MHCSRTTQRPLQSMLLMAFGAAMASDYNLIILHQNDLHSRYESIDRFGAVCRGLNYDTRWPCHGGFARAVAYVKEIKKMPYSPNTIVVNSGDFFQGELMHVMFTWEIAAKMAKLMPYDALAIGNKDFNEGLDGLLPFMRAIGSTTFVCTNFDFSLLNITMQDELNKLCPRHRILTYSGKRIGILSYLFKDASLVARTGDILFSDEIQSLSTEVKVLRKKGVKIFIALGHSGYERDLQIAYQVPSLDVVIGGHSHTLLWPNPFTIHQAGKPPGFEGVEIKRSVFPYPTVVVQRSGRRVLVLQSFTNGMYVGNINVTFDSNDEVKDWWSQPALLQKGMKEDVEVKQTLRWFQDRLKNNSNDVIGYSLVQVVGIPDECYLRECNMGNLLADAYVWSIRHESNNSSACLPTVAFIDAGQIRSDMPMGVLKLKDLENALPYRNLVQVVTINGSSVLGALEHSVEVAYDEGGRFLQFAGARVTYDMDRPPGSRVVSAELLCNDCPIPQYEPINLSHTYDIAVTTYLMYGVHNYTMLTNPLKIQTLDILDLQALINYIRRMSPVHPSIDGRIQGISDVENDVPNGTDNPHGPKRSHMLLTTLLLISLCRASGCF